MDEKTTATAPAAPPAPPPAAAAPPAVPSQPSVDIERFSRNIARMVEEGGKALAAYLEAARRRHDQDRAGRRNLRHGEDLRPRGRILAVRSAARDRDPDDARQGLSRALGGCREAAVRRERSAGHRAQIRGTSVLPIRNGHRTSSTTSSSRPICSARNGPSAW